MKKFLYILFHRSVFVALALVAQIATLAVMVSIFSEYTETFYWCCIALSVMAALAIVGSRMEPGYKIAWLILVLPFPVFGGLFYLLIGGGYIPKRTQRRMQGVLKKSAATLKDDFKSDDLLPLGGDAAGQASYLERRAACPAYTNTETEYFPLGDDAFPRMLDELKKAERYIFLEYFIIQPGVFWDSILAVLEEKVAQGVEVRVLYDDFGCMFTLPRDYNETLTKKGIQCRVFNRLMPVMSLRLNNRDHRKLLIIDGKVGFTGGINLADEYIGKKERFGIWKDTAVMIEGDAVRSFTLMFLEMWNVEKHRRAEIFDPYLDVEQIKFPVKGDGFVMPYGDSPLDNEQVGESVYMDILYTAKDYVHIMTPYLILGHEMITALTYAAKRGVEVIIMMPHIPDKKYAFMLAKTYYCELMDAGVQIYEYTPGFVHAKVFTSDDRKAVVGTINLDYRSLYLHFECAVYLYRNSVIPSIEADFQETLKECRKMSREDVKSQPLGSRIAGKALRLLAPLM